MRDPSWHTRVDDILKQLGIPIIEGQEQAYLTAAQGAEALDVLGPVVAMLIATQPKAAIKAWLEAVVGVAEKHQTFMRRIVSH